ncbi:MAG: glycosyltransferase family 9 protein [Planctomycetes bacterium]|nr:glycosyltransferase family 9 protein [Planctomycetota bacterium]
MNPREESCRRIAVRLPNWVGDVVMATPLLRALRSAAPHATITAIGTAPCGRLLAGAPWFDRYVALDARGRHGGLLGWWRAGRDVAADGRPDLHLLLPHSLSSGLIGVASRARCLAGYWTRERGWLLDCKPRLALEGRRRLPLPMTRLYLDLLRALGVDARDESLALPLSEAETTRGEAMLHAFGIDSNESFIAANPGAAFGASKFWTVEGFAETIRGLHQRRGWRTLVLCGPGEAAQARTIADAAGPAAIDTSSAPVPLELLKPVLRRAALLLTTDTGPRHIATAFKTPCVVLMGPTDPRHTASNLERTRVLRVDVPCGPCHLKTCPLDHRCMTSLTAAMALQATDELLAASTAA